MSELIPHSCPKDDYDEVFVSAGKLCPNGCGWLAVDGDAEIYAVKQIRAALELWGPWLRLREAADQSCVPFSTIAQAVREGRLPALQLGRQRFVRLSAVLGKIGLHGKHGRPRIPPPSPAPQSVGGENMKDVQQTEQNTEGRQN